MKTKLKNNKAIDLAAWKNPPAEFRPAPLWTWNDKLEPDELRRQVGLFAEHGFGGFFMHARVGLMVPYLGDEWFECIRVATEEAARLGIKAWIYDEERWPSGYAGGKIAETGLDYAGYGLACREHDGKRMFEVVRSVKSPWLNGACDPDMLNPEVTEAFLHLTHDAYEKHIGEHFGTTTPGSFCDEPNYIQWARPDRFDLVPWTKDIETIFEKQHGYALQSHLVSLFYDEGEYQKVRVDFYRTVTKLLVAGFTRPLYDWCAKRGIASVGHMLMEDNLLYQVRAVGATMPNYEYFHIPGIDYLGDRLSWPVLQKQCDSVVHQLGRERMICEAFGASGWETSLGKLKPVADLLLVLGSNLMNQHMALYSIRGCRKRDFPPSSFYQLPGFPLYKSFNDYMGRLSYLLTCGAPVRRVVMLHPMQSAWALFSPKNTKLVEELDGRFTEISKRLLEVQRDYDYADELLLEKHGGVVNGKLVVGLAQYQTVVIPSAETWSGNTLALLQKFAEQGGKIIAIEPVAASVDGKHSDTLNTFFRSSAVTRIAKPTPSALNKALATIPRDIQVTDEKGQLVKTLIHMHRKCGERDIYFLTFGTNPKEFQAQIELEGEGEVELWDAETGDQRPLAAISEKGRTKLKLEIPVRGSRLLVLNRDRSNVPQSTISAVTEESPVIGPWRVTRLDPNVFVLDRAELKLDQSPWSMPMGVAGFGKVGGVATAPNICDTIALCIERGVQPRDVKTWLRFRITVKGERIDSAATWLVIEDTRAMTDIKVNGKPMTITEDKWWLDPGFRKIDVRGALRPGANQIQCRLHWVKAFMDGTFSTTPDGTEPDNCYLIGDFNVDWNGGSRVCVTDAQPLPVDPATDLCRAGLPFYAGRVRYETVLSLTKFDRKRRYILRFPKPHGEGVRLSINGRFVKDLWGDPFEADCTAFLRSGENQIQVDLYSTLGNTLGHYHHQYPWTDPGHMFARYFFKPLGLGGTPILKIS